MKAVFLVVLGLWSVTPAWAHPTDGQAAIRVGQGTRLVALYDVNVIPLEEYFSIQDGHVVGDGAWDLEKPFCNLLLAQGSPRDRVLSAGTELVFSGQSYEMDSHNGYFAAQLPMESPASVNRLSCFPPQKGPHKHDVITMGELREVLHGMFELILAEPTPL